MVRKVVATAVVAREKVERVAVVKGWAQPVEVGDLAGVVKVGV